MAVSIISVQAVQFSNPGEILEDGVDVTVRLTQPQLASLVSEYDAGSASTPSASTCRAIARPMAAAIAEGVASGTIPDPNA
jgi:hypothetical protein